MDLCHPLQTIANNLLGGANRIGGGFHQGILRPRRILSTPHPGFPSDSNLKMFFRCSQSRRYSDTVRGPSADSWLTRERVYRLSVSSNVTACDFLYIGRLHFLNRGVHLGFGVLQWSKVVDFGKSKNVTKNNPHLNLCTLLADSYS